MSYEDELNKAIGKRLQTIRSLSDLTQGQLANRLGAMGLPMAQQTIAKIENGTRPLKLAEAEAITTIIGQPIDALVPADEDDALEVYELTALVNYYMESIDTVAMHIAESKRNQERAREAWRTAREPVRRAYLAQLGDGGGEWVEKLLTEDVAARASSTLAPGAELKLGKGLRR